MSSSRRLVKEALRHALLVALAGLAGPLLRGQGAPGPGDSLLLIRPDHLGDVLFTTPSVRRLRQCIPDAKITYLAGPWAAEVLERNPHIDDILYCDFPWFNGRPRTSLSQPYSTLIAWAHQLRGRGFAAAVNLRFDFWWGAALAHLAGIPYRLGYATPDCRPFLSDAVAYQSGRHEVIQNLNLIDRLCERQKKGSDATEWSVLEFPLSVAERAFANDYLTAKGLNPDGPLVIVHPGTRAAVKEWPEDRFAQLIASLDRRAVGTVLLTGSKSERALAERIAARVSHLARVAAGDTTVGQLAALMERAAVVIGVDSGPLHLAAALGRPTVHLFGPSDHVAFAPVGDPARHVVVRAGLECSPCRHFDWPAAELESHQCVAAITVEQVLQAVEQATSGALGEERIGKER